MIHVLWAGWARWGKGKVGTEEMKVVRNRLTWVVLLAP